MAKRLVAAALAAMLLFAAYALGVLSGIVPLWPVGYGYRSIVLDAVGGPAVARAYGEPWTVDWRSRLGYRAPARMYGTMTFSAISAPWYSIAADRRMRFLETDFRIVEIEYATAYGRKSRVFAGFPVSPPKNADNLVIVAFNGSSSRYRGGGAFDFIQPYDGDRNYQYRWPLQLSALSGAPFIAPDDTHYGPSRSYDESNPAQLETMTDLLGVRAGLEWLQREGIVRLDAPKFFASGYSWGGSRSTLFVGHTREVRATYIGGSNHLVIREPDKTAIHPLEWNAWQWSHGRVLEHSSHAKIRIAYGTDDDARKGQQAEIARLDALPHIEAKITSARGHRYDISDLTDFFCSVASCLTTRVQN